MISDIPILVLFSTLASDAWITRVLNTFKLLISRNIRTIEIPGDVSLADIEENRVHLDVDGEHKLILCLGIPPDLLLEIPSLAHNVGAEAVLVPVEDHRWAPPGLQKQVEEVCKSLGIECMFPKPFCSFTNAESSVLKMVVERVGRPILRIEVETDKIKQIEVLRTAPCGATFEVARLLIGKRVDEAPRLAGLYQSSICLASRYIDPILGDSLNHISSYITANAVKEALVKHNR